MKVLGIIAEYNPFHNGHLYHLKQAKALCNADFVVCVMSGNFIQRGEPAIVDKWARAGMALLSGIDLVIELPVVYAMSSAEFFADGAVKILDKLGVVDYLCFGSEAGSIGQLDLIASILVDEPEKYKAYLKEELQKGRSYPASRETALNAYINLASISNPILADNLLEESLGKEPIQYLLKNSNNILGIEYLKALKKLKSIIKPITILRKGSSYNSEIIEGAISSATSIRKQILSADGNNNLCELGKALPKHTLDILQTEFSEGRGPISPHDYEAILLSALRKMSVNEISELPYIAEGLENRIKSAADCSGSLNTLIENISTKRYTKTRIQRCIFSILTGMKKSELEIFNMNQGPQYIRILGFNQKGRQLLSIINKTAALPVIMKTADFKNTNNHLANRMLGIEAAASDQYVLAYKNNQFRNSGQEFTRNIINIGKK